MFHPINKESSVNGKAQVRKSRDGSTEEPYDQSHHDGVFVNHCKENVKLIDDKG
jgi:hypothetical protein